MLDSIAIVSLRINLLFNNHHFADDIGFAKLLLWTMYNSLIVRAWVHIPILNLGNMYGWKSSLVEWFYL